MVHQAERTSTASAGSASWVQGAGDALHDWKAEIAELRRQVAFWREYAGELERELAAASARAWDVVAEVPLRAAWESIVDARLAGEPGRTAVVFADLDRFKAINDAHGHLAGDAVLRAVARRLEEAFAGRAALVTRLGGDEFGVVVRDVDAANDLARFAELMRESIALPYGRSVRVSASVGVAWAAELPPGAGREELLRTADAATYSDKHRRQVDVGVRGAPSPRSRTRGRAGGAVVLGAVR